MQSPLFKPKLEIFENRSIKMFLQKILDGLRLLALQKVLFTISVLSLKKSELLHLIFKKSAIFFLLERK